MIFSRCLSILMPLFLSGSLWAGSNSSARGSQLWNQVHVLASSGKNSGALKAIAQLEKIKSSGISSDEISLMKGRVLYQAERFSDAIRAYSQISKTSHFWLASVEERAWAKVRIGLFNEALADSRTLMSPLFSDVIGPEGYYVSSFIAHRVCDFKSVFSISDSFKDKNKLRIIHLEKMANMEKTRGIADFTDSLKKHGLKKSLSPQVISFFPTHFYLDKNIVKIARKASSFSFSGVALRKALARLAKKQLKLYKDVIARMHLIEGDVIQRLFLDPSLKGKRTSVGSGIQAGKYDLQFPYEAKDVWIDEVDKLKVNAKNCPHLKSQGVQI